MEGHEEEATSAALSSEPETPPRAGTKSLLRDAASGYTTLLHRTLAPVLGSLAQLQSLAAELKAADSSREPRGQDLSWGQRRSLLQFSSPTLACGGLGDLSLATPSSNSSIVILSSPEVDCNLPVISYETVVMANILGADADTASAVDAAQASVTDMMSVVTTLNDKMDGTDGKFSAQITVFNQEANAAYSSAAQDLQVRG